ncbi:hypothetical protein [Effusibacillus dendaii]|uniref:hypothetical protein n=1 Tax=Effusibacillus dendaii TaxID=2743772 RepID=UPI00190E0272|nr:hypothetical protein [Effusibacillus dendaii]
MTRQNEFGYSAPQPVLFHHAIFNPHRNHTAKKPKKQAASKTARPDQRLSSLPTGNKPRC